MESVTASWTRRIAPEISENTVDVWRSPFDLKTALAKGPVFIYFIMDGCPCSIDAQPLFSHLRDKFGGPVTFVGVINTDAPKGLKWASANNMTDPLLPDPKLKIIKAYKASNSAFSALVLPDGTIAKMWPGYSRDYMLDMNERLCKALGQPVTPFDPLYAPLAKTAGCYFTTQE